MNVPLSQHPLTERHAAEIASGERFSFGANWARYLRALGPERIDEAKRSLLNMLELDSLMGRSFLDVGSGSGLFSLAARMLGARVHSFDYDPQSVACAGELRRRYFPEDDQWRIEQGSVLDTKYLDGLGEFDVVYSWGVLHHTGAMEQALANVTALVRRGGLLFISIYNDQGRISRQWRWVKRTYNSLPGALKGLVLWPVAIQMWFTTMLRDLVVGRPFSTWRNYKRTRGMSPWWDIVDWVGGYPFEVARPERIFDFFRQRGFTLIRLKTCGGGLGCNEFVFQRNGSEPATTAAQTGI